MRKLLFCRQCGRRGRAFFCPSQSSVSKTSPMLAFLAGLQVPRRGRARLGSCISIPLHVAWTVAASRSRRMGLWICQRFLSRGSSSPCLNSDLQLFHLSCDIGIQRNLKHVCRTQTRKRFQNVAVFFFLKKNLRISKSVSTAQATTTRIAQTSSCTWLNQLHTGVHIEDILPKQLSTLSSGPLPPYVSWCSCPQLLSSKMCRIRVEYTRTESVQNCFPDFFSSL